MGENIDILNSTPDKEIYWSADPMQEIGISQYMRYDKAILNFAKAFLELKNLKFDVGDLGDKPFSRDEAVIALITKLNNLDSSDIEHSGNPFNNNRLSVEAAKFLGSKFTYTVTTDNNGSKLDINIKEGLFDNVLSTRIIVSGKSTDGKNIAMDTSEKITSVLLKNSMYPIDIDVNVRIQTKTGVVDLEKKVILHNPSDSGTFTSIYDVKDRSYTAPFSGKLSEWLGGIEATQDRLEQYHDVLKNTSNGDIVNTVSHQGYLISSAQKDIDKMSKVSISVANSDGTITQKEVTPQEAVTILSKNINNLLSDNTNLKNELKKVQSKVGNISNPAGGGTEGTTNFGNSTASNSVV